ncbi:MAG: YcaO-related McrA-glycine thioamidation protein [Methanomassiliicoccales archaeon]
MKLSHSSRGEGGRAVSAAETLAHVEPLAKVAGITRVADITGLDRIGIFVFSSIRPTAQGGAISVYNGKGLTVEQAKVSAIMEGIERYCAEVHDRPLRRELAASAVRKGALEPRALILPSGAEASLPYGPVAWTPGFDIEGGEVMVPANAVFHPYLPRGDVMLFRSSTNGLASGNTMEEAVLHGLMELIERDAWSIAEARRRFRGGIDASGSEKISRVLDMFASNGVEVQLKDMTSDLGVPTVAAAADDVRMQDAGLLTLGMGTDMDAESAALRALVEVAQSRLTQIHGAREDTTRADTNRQLGYERMKRLNAHWFSPEKENTKLAEIPSLETGDVLDDLVHVQFRLTVAGLGKVLFADLSRPEIEMPVVRVLVPGLECSAIDPDRMGRRLRR